MAKDGKQSLTTISPFFLDDPLNSFSVIVSNFFFFLTLLPATPAIHFYCTALLVVVFIIILCAFACVGTRVLMHLRKRRVLDGMRKMSIDSARIENLTRSCIEPYKILDRSDSV
jgi:hypothetical protein